MLATPPLSSPRLHRADVTMCQCCNVLYATTTPHACPVRIRHVLYGVGLLCLSATLVIFACWFGLRTLGVL